MHNLSSKTTADTDPSARILANFKPFKAFDEDSGKEFLVTDQMMMMKAKSESFFQQTQFYSGRVLQLIRDKKIYLAFRYNSFSQFMKHQEYFPERTAWDYLKIADYFHSYLPLVENLDTTANVAVISSNGTVNTDFTFKMRIEAKILEQVAVSKLYVLVAMEIPPEKIVGREDITLPDGEVLTHEQLLECTVKELKAHSAPAGEEADIPETVSQVKNPVADLKEFFTRQTSLIDKTRELISQFETTQAALDMCVEERRELQDAVRKLGTAITSDDSFCLTPKEDAPQLKDSEFITANEIADLTGKSVRAIQHIAGDGKIPVSHLKAEKAGGRTEYRIHPDGLPDEYRNLYYAGLHRRAAEQKAQQKRLRKKQRRELQKKLTADQWRKTINIEYCIEQYGHLKGQELKPALATHNKNHPDEKPVRYKSFLRHVKNYDSDGLKGIADLRGVHRKGETKVKEDDFDYFRSAYLTQNEKSHQQCWQETFGKAKKEGRITAMDGLDYEVDPATGEVLGRFPSVSSFRRVLDRRIPEATQVEMRKGKHRFKQTIHFSHIDITRENVQAGRVYVMDHHTVDVLCKPSDKKVVAELTNKILYHNLSKVEKAVAEKQLRRILKSALSNKKHVRLWLTACMDFKTNKQLAWFVHEDAPNTDHVMLTFKWACQKWGYPDVLMMDNGKDFLAYDFAGNPYRKNQVHDDIQINNLFSMIPTEPHFAKPYESQAKPIEREFRKVITKVAKQYPTYTGPNPAKRPESCVEALKKGNAPLALEVAEDIEDAMELLNRIPGNGKILRGKSPDQLWNELNPERRMLEKDAYELMTMRNTKPRQLHGNGFKMPLMGGHYYWGDWMHGLSSTKDKYFAKWDPYDWQKIYVFKLVPGKDDAEPMGWAHLAKRPSGWTQTPEEKQDLQMALEKKKAADKRRRLHAKDIKKIAVGESFENLNAYADHYDEVYEDIHGIRDEGRTPPRLVQSKIGDLAHRMKNESFENEIKRKENLDLAPITPKGPEPAKLKSPLDHVDVSDVFEGEDEDSTTNNNKNKDES